MTYRHRVYLESAAYEKLAGLAAQAGAVIAELPDVPHVHFFKEDPAGRYQRQVRCSGFIDYRSHAEKLDIFVRGGLSPAETVKVIFHESGHVSQFHSAHSGTLSAEEGEARARQFEYLAQGKGIQRVAIVCNAASVIVRDVPTEDCRRSSRRERRSRRGVDGDMLSNGKPEREKH